jgi:hypothetical protein
VFARVGANDLVEETTVAVVDFGGGNRCPALQILGRGQVGDEPGVETVAQAEENYGQAQQDNKAGCYTRPQESGTVVS